MATFRFRAGKRPDGTFVHVKPAIWQACKRMVGRENSLHGRMKFAEFVSETKAKVTFEKDGKLVTKLLEWDSVRWSNLRNEDIAGEPERRQAWKARQAEARRELPRGTDERIVDAVKPALDPDAQHHRGFARFGGGCRT